MLHIIDGIPVTAPDDSGATVEELTAYLHHAQEKHPEFNLKGLNVTFDGEDAILDYVIPAHTFHRIRRITGYLVGTLDRFNNGKRAEERDRVKHTLGGQQV